jgi:carboxymethylenebutenolidase
MKQLVSTVSTDDGSMDIHVTIPPSANRHRRQAVLVFQEAFGVNPHMLRVCERLAGAGYIAAAPELFHRTGRGVQFGYGDFDQVRPVLSQLTNARLLMDARAAYEFLAARADVDPRQIATIGFCMGGFVSALAACHLHVATAMSFYGGGVARARPGIGFTPLLEDFASLSCPALFIFGDKDQSIPREDIEAVRARLMALGKPHEIVVYPGVGHGFFCDERPSYDAVTAQTAWDKILDWLGSHLTPPLAR